MTASPPETTLDTVRTWVAQAERLCVLTGAGVSAASGVPTFRDAQTGYWAQFRAEDMASAAGFRANPGRVWQWYQHRKALIAAVQPNAAHHALAQWSLQHPGAMTLVTQNVDGLHQRAGSTDVLCLHGDLWQDRWLNPTCPQCNADVLTDGEPPACPCCGNLRRPGVVWFGEMLPGRVLANAQAAAEACDVLLVVGTAGVVYPAAGLAQLARRCGRRVVVLNTAATDLDSVADAVLRGPATSSLPAVLLSDEGEGLQPAVWY
ncbi:MAG: NAD-dependent deacylase [Acidovorax sp.]|nr:NAD-dependent deacylase [Acidovorax sp.]